nr:transcriptional regulator [Leucobacter chinensis]
MRFSLMAVLQPGLEIDFVTLRTNLEAHDSTLSKAITYLQQQEYVAVRKTAIAQQSRTRVIVTARGSQAFSRHLSALRAIAEGITERT